MRSPPSWRQQSFDDLGSPLSDVTFCVLDLETTGTSPSTCEITEVGAVLVRGGERIGTFQTFVNPGAPIPVPVALLTGITGSMVDDAPPIEAVFGPLAQFCGDAVIVGHNVRFDLGFLHAAADRHCFPRLTNRSVDTCRLARRLLVGEVSDFRLSTLAAHLRLPAQPCHRAFADAAATADLLHALLERAAGLGVLGLDDLMELPQIGRHPQAPKLRLTTNLPRSPGVYIFRDRAGTPLYVGKATNLRARVRSYFGQDERRKVGPLLQATASIDHFRCATAIEAAVLEVRLIQRHLPRFNRASTQWPKYAYLRVGGTCGRPHVAATRDPGGRGLPIGPLSSLAMARVAADALREALTDQPSDRLAVEAVLDPALLAPLHVRMRALADDERFEEASCVRDRAGTLARAVDRHRKLDGLRRAGRLQVRWQEHSFVIDHGILTLDADTAGSLADHYDKTSDPATATASTAIAAREVDERWLVAAWLDAQAHRALLLECDVPLALPRSRPPRFDPLPPRAMHRAAPTLPVRRGTVDVGRR